MATGSNLSPFLSLPPEIRNRVYSYVLGGRVLHIGLREVDGSLRARYCACAATITDEELAWSVEDHTDTRIVHGGALSHFNCRVDSIESRARRVSIALLRTCRQIYEEASLILYAENTFSFGQFCYSDCRTKLMTAPYACFDNFVQSLLLKQKLAIKNVVLASCFGTMLYRRLFWGKTRNITSLSNIQKLTVLVTIPNAQDPEEYTGEEGLDYLFDLMKFEKISAISSVRLCLVDEYRAVPKECWHWWKALEDKITKACAKLAHQEKMKAKKEEQKAKVARNEKTRSVQIRTEHGMRLLERKFYL